jgi:hypothetical protein
LGPGIPDPLVTAIRRSAGHRVPHGYRVATSAILGGFIMNTASTRMPREYGFTE